MPITYFQNDVVTITYDENLQLGAAVWNGFLSSTEFREASETCLRLIEEHRPLRWLGDNRKLRAIRQTDQNWFAEQITPRLAASSLRRNAILISEDFFNRMAVDQIVKRATSLGNMEVMEFDKREEAMAWLLEPIHSLEQG